MKEGGSISQLLIIVALTILGIFYAIGWLNTGNALWMLPMQPEYEPQRIIIRDAGQETVLQKGQAGFNELSDALNTSFSDFTNADLVPIGLSEVALNEYNDEAFVLEVYYPQKIRFNLPARMKNVNQLLIPIEGRNAKERYVFMGYNGKWLAGALAMASDEALKQTLRDLGYINQLGE